MTIEQFMQDWDVRRAARNEPQALMVIRGLDGDYSVGAVHWSDERLVLDLGPPMNEAGG